MSDSPMYVYRGEALANYGFGDEHPFGMDRHEAFHTELAESGLGTAIQYVEPQRASVEDIALFHTSEYIELVSKRSQEGTGFLDDGDTPADHPVEKRGLTNVGSAYDGDDRNPFGVCGRTHRAHRLLRHSVIS